MTYYGYMRESPRSLSSPARRAWIFVNVLLLHFAIIGGPWLWMQLRGKVSPPKENRFKVKLGDTTPSHAPEVGPPERTRPRPAPPSPPTPAPPEPKVVPRPKPRPAEPKIAPRPKPKPKPNTRPKPRPAEPRVVPRKAEPKVVNKRDSAQKRQEVKRRNIEDQIYHPPGGNNFNPNVKIGSRNAGQVKGPADHKTPQGGLTQAEEAYYASLKKFLDFRWVEPSRTVLGDLRPTAVLELNIAADGRVLGAKIVESSGNVSMEASVRRLISVLDRVPAPPNGQLTILVNMEVK